MYIGKLQPPQTSNPEDPTLSTYENQLSQATEILKAIDPNFSHEAVEEDSNYGNLYVGLEAEEAIAAAIFHPLSQERSESGETEGWLSYLAVKPELQRHGFGSEMVNYFSVLCLTRGMRSLNVITQKDADGFFESRGFDPVKHPVFEKILQKDLTKSS